MAELQSASTAQIQGMTPGLTWDLVWNCQLWVEERRLRPVETAQNFEAESDSDVAGLSDKLAADVVAIDRGHVCKDLMKKINIFIRL